jgi:hypothetical protein
MLSVSIIGLLKLTPTLFIDVQANAWKHMYILFQVFPFPH